MVSKESIAIIKPRENKIRNDSSGSFHRKILSDRTDPPGLKISQLTEFFHLFLQWQLTVKNDTEITSCTGKGDVTLIHTYRRRKINSRSRAHEKNLCFVVI